MHLTVPTPHLSAGNSVGFSQALCPDNANHFYSALLSCWAQGTLGSGCLSRPYPQMQGKNLLRIASEMYMLVFSVWSNATIIFTVTQTKNLDLSLILFCLTPIQSVRKFSQLYLQLYSKTTFCKHPIATISCLKPVCGLTWPQ